MVGPRSTGCRRCVSRRIKCDETRPHCHRCTRANLQCPGYSTPFQFLALNVTKCSRCLSENVNCVRKGTKCTRCRKYKLQCDLNKDPFVSSDRYVGSNNSGSSSAGDIARQSDNSETQTTDTMSETLTLSPNQYNEDVFCLFFLERCFSFGAWNEELQNNRSWMWSALQHPSESPISNLALRSMVTIFFANANHNPELAKTSLELNGRTLRALNRSMKEKSGKDVSFDTMSAIVLLGLYESCSLTNPTAWLDHVSGARTLFEMKGPQFFCTRPARSLLMFSRYTILVEAIILRKRCFLEEKAWQEPLKCEEEPVYASTIKLGNLLSSLPGLFEDIKNLEAIDATDPAFASKLTAIFDAFLAQIDELREWWEAWSSDPKRLPKRVKIEGDLEKNLDEYYPAGVGPANDLGVQPSSVLRLHSLETAAGHCRYHAHFIVAIRWLNRLLWLQGDANVVDTEELSRRNLQLVESPILPRSSSSSTATSTVSPFLVVSEADIMPHAYAICEILPTYSLPQYRHVGAMYMGFPARVAWQCLPKDSPHCGWIEKFMETMAESSGFEIPRRVLRSIKLNG